MFVILGIDNSVGKFEQCGRLLHAVMCAKDFEGIVNSIDPYNQEKSDQGLHGLLTLSVQKRRTFLASYLLHIERCHVYLLVRNQNVTLTVD